MYLSRSRQYSSTDSRAQLPVSLARSAGEGRSRCLGAGFSGPRLPKLNARVVTRQIAAGDVKVNFW